MCGRYLPLLTKARSRKFVGVHSLDGETATNLERVVPEGPPAKLSPSAAAKLALGLASTWLPALLAPQWVRAAAELVNLERPPASFLLDRPGLLFLGAPLVVLSACILLLSPGLLLAIALNRGKSLAEWLLFGFALSLTIVSVAAGIVQGLLGTPLVGWRFAAVVIACSLLSAGFLFGQLKRGRSVTHPLTDRSGRATLLLALAVPYLLLCVFAPKFYWENFNGDGAHAFESARLLLVQPVPFWPAETGDIAEFPGVVSMLFAFPASWFIRLFGELEVSARVPVLVYLVALHAALVALIEHGRSAPVPILDRALIWLALAVYFVTMAFSATYAPYSADIALPATEDTLRVFCFLGFVLCFVAGDQKWMYFFLALTFVSSPGGTMTVALWLAAALWVWRKQRLGLCLRVGAGLAVCLVAGALLPLLLRTIGLPEPGQEYGASQMVRRFVRLQLFDFQRFAFLVVPAGILPALALFDWKRQDEIARSITLVTAAYFATFYVQAHISLHHFAPAMLLPLVVFWRNSRVSDSQNRVGYRVAAGVAAAAALVLSLPRAMSVDTSGRVVGAMLANRFPGYDVSKPPVFREAELLRELFPFDWDPRVPKESYGGTPLVWNYYAQRHDGPTRSINYVLQPSSWPEPSNMQVVAREGEAAVYVANRKLWDHHRALRPPTPAGAPVYALSRAVLFRSVPPQGGPPIIDVAEVLAKLIPPLAPILERARNRGESSR
jgi:hypothetical protein